ncbi:hypothetical protein ACFWWN_08880, partial [Streptomyces sp. NPDC059082]
WCGGGRPPAAPSPPRGFPRRAPAPSRAPPPPPQAREEYGNVTGHAIGKGPDKSAGHDILADVLDVIAEGEKAVWCERIATRLASLRPDTYAGWKGENVTAALKPYGIKAGQVWGTTDEGKGANRRGIDRTDLTAALTRRNADRAAA